VILMLSLFAYVVGLLGTFALVVGGLTSITVTLADRRCPCSLRVPTGILCGYIAGVLFVWILVPRDWTLSFWTTLAAAVNAAKYGHPVEHYAEGIVVAMMFCAVVGAVVGGSVTHIAGRLLRQRRARPVSG
jgi:multisubunit Na+/H+ antiporter MnhB subunit